MGTLPPDRSIFTLPREVHRGKCVIGFNPSISSSGGKSGTDTEEGSKEKGREGNKETGREGRCLEGASSSFVFKSLNRQGRFELWLILLLCMCIYYNRSLCKTVHYDSDTFNEHNDDDHAWDGSGYDNDCLSDGGETIMIMMVVMINVDHDDDENDRLRCITLS